MDLVRRRRVAGRRAGPVVGARGQRAPSRPRLPARARGGLPDRAALAAGLMFARARRVRRETRVQPADCPAGSRDEPAILVVVPWRADAARAAGLTDVVERLRYEWTPESGVPGPSHRLVFRPGSDEEFLAAFGRVAVGSLDIVTQRDLVVHGRRPPGQG